MGASIRIDDVIVPPLSESVDDGAVAKIYFETGYEVKRDQMILTIDTAKVAVDLYSPSLGCVNYLVAVGDVVRAGDVVAKIVVDLDAHPEEAIVPKAEPAKTGYKAAWEGCTGVPKSNPARRYYTDEEIRQKAQELFDATAPTRVIIPLDRCLDSTVAYFTAWAKRTVDQ